MTNASDDLVERTYDAIYEANGCTLNAGLPIKEVLKNEFAYLRARLAAAEDEVTRQFYCVVVAETKLATATKALEQIEGGTTDETYPFRAMDRSQMKDVARIALRAIEEKP